MLGSSCPEPQILACFKDLCTEIRIRSTKKGRFFTVQVETQKRNFGLQGYGSLQKL